MEDLVTLFTAIAAGDRSVVTPSSATARLARSDEFFLASRSVQVYEGDTALHVAAFSYSVEICRALVGLGASLSARNRRGGSPLHAAVAGSPGSVSWDPGAQRAVILYLVSVGGDPNGRALGGVTPLHRAVRNRCSGAVAALLSVGADPLLANDHGSTALDLARWATGRGGTGSAAAKVEQRAIVELLG